MYSNVLRYQINMLDRCIPLKAQILRIKTDFMSIVLSHIGLILFHFGDFANVRVWLRNARLAEPLKWNKKLRTLLLLSYLVVR